MKDFFKGKFITGLIVVATVILAGVAIFTAIRLYQLRQENISPTGPESEPAAWDCSNYTFAVNGNGGVTVANNSTRNEPPQQAQVYINDQLVATFDVPGLPTGQSATLGTVQVPQGEAFTWRVIGTLDCQSSGKAGSKPAACTQLKFTLAEATLTPTPSEGVTQTPTPSQPPLGGTSPTPTFSQTGPPECVATKPDAPTITSVVKDGTKATITWTKVAGTTHYTLSYGTQQGKYDFGVPNTGNVTTYTVQNLNASSTYYFVVYAVNDCMPSNASAVVSSVAGTGTGGALPDAGISAPTVFGLSLGFLLIVAALLLAI